MSDYVYFPVLDDVRRNLIVTTLFLVLATVAVIVRILARRQSCLDFWWDDWLIIAAWPFTTIMIAIQIVLALHGTGYQPKQIVINIYPNGQLQAAFRAFYHASLVSSKASILFFYLRIFTAHDWTLLYTRLTLYLVFAWGIVFNIASLSTCPPSPEPHNTCLSQTALTTALNVTNVVTDLMIIIIPQYALSRLSLPVKDKLGLMSCFVFGIACVGLVVYRIGFNLVPTPPSDINSNQITNLLTYNLEPCLALICACLPMCRRFLVKPCRRRSGWTGRSWRIGSIRSRRPLPLRPLLHLPVMVLVERPNAALVRGASYSGQATV